MKKLLIPTFLLLLALHVTAQPKSDCQKQCQQEEYNKKMVVEFYQQLFGDKDAEAILKYVKEDYIQHNPMLPDGRDTLYKSVKIWFKNAPKDKVDFQRIVADDDLVVLHIRSKMGNKTRAVVDIFRIQDGKIAEHWDVIQEVPEKSANPHPMF
ncbi:MAG TPA: ester cyclase [Bacteroidales bacterium]|nr:ester cyclase [Bacteroidales bacterium]